MSHSWNGFNGEGLTHELCQSDDTVLMHSETKMGETHICSVSLAVYVIFIKDKVIMVPSHIVPLRDVLLMSVARVTFDIYSSILS